MSHDITQTRWAHACMLSIEKALGREFSGPDAAKVQGALLNPPWQPIESAPKDGTEILGWGSEAPTHWLPLPPPPQEQA